MVEVPPRQQEFDSQCRFVGLMLSMGMQHQTSICLAGMLGSSSLTF
jgi:hypothetical protein